MRVAVVGGGPAGSLLAYHLARGGAEAVVFDASHPREKPCGGGLTVKALQLLPPAPATDPLPVRMVGTCRFESGDGEGLELRLAKPVAVASRLKLDSWLLRRATGAGARHASERVVEVSGSGELRTAAGRAERFDVIVGADGAGSLVRRTLLKPIPKEQLGMALGWYAPGSSPMLVRFMPGLAGYMWLFPRPDHVGVGICAPLGSLPTRELRARLAAEVERDFPELGEAGATRYAHTIPSPSADPASLAEIAGKRFALVGDAAGLTDPITGEGLYYAFRSALVLADTLREDGAVERYAERVVFGFGRELLKAAAISERFYAPGFSRRMIRYASRSEAIRTVMGDLVLGDQGYLDLKRRLIRAAPRVALQAGLPWLFSPA